METTSNNKVLSEDLKQMLLRHTDDRKEISDLQHMLREVQDEARDMREILQQSDSVRHELIAKLDARELECARLRKEAMTLSEQMRTDREAASRAAERAATDQQAL